MKNVGRRARPISIAKTQYRLRHKVYFGQVKIQGGNKIERAFRVVMIRCASASTIYFPVYPDQFRELLAWLTIPVQ